MHFPASTSFPPPTAKMQSGFELIKLFACLSTSSLEHSPKNSAFEYAIPSLLSDVKTSEASAEKPRFEASTATLFALIN